MNTPMTAAEITGVLNTADKLFTESQTAAKVGLWSQYFLLISDAQSALMYLQLKLSVSAEVRYQLQKLIEVIQEHREVSLHLIESEGPKGEA